MLQFPFRAILIINEEDRRLREVVFLLYHQAGCAKLLCLMMNSQVVTEQLLAALYHVLNSVSNLYIGQFCVATLCRHHTFFTGIAFC